MGRYNTLTAAVQMMLPGETVVTHRHIHSALRFITHGSGATTTVSGGKVTLSEGDLVITPSWAWHDHSNESSGPVIWMDGVDRPLVKMLDAVFFEVYPQAGYQPVTRTGDDATFQLDMDGLSASRFSPQLAYRWDDTWAALSALRSAGDPCPYDDISLVFRNPLNGGHITPTMGAAVQLLTPGRRTRAHRHTSSAVYHVYRGRGYSIINGHRYDWEQGDYVALPPRMWHEHANFSSHEDAILFSIDDKPAYEALSLYRDESYVTNGGHQGRSKARCGRSRGALGRRTQTFFHRPRQRSRQSLMRQREAVFVDSGAWIALALTRDPLHEQARGNGICCTEWRRSFIRRWRLSSKHLRSSSGTPIATSHCLEKLDLCAGHRKASIV